MRVCLILLYINILYSILPFVSRCLLLFSSIFLFKNDLERREEKKEEGWKKGKNQDKVEGRVEGTGVEGAGVARQQELRSVPT